jgi:hypothetical protein
MEANSKRGRPPIIASEERARLLGDKGLGSERWALDRRFMEAALSALNGENCPFIMPTGKRPRSSLLVELGRWGDKTAIKFVAKTLEEAASENKMFSIKEAISQSRGARLKLKGERAKMTDQGDMPIVSTPEPQSDLSGLSLPNLDKGQEIVVSSTVREEGETTRNEKTSREKWDELPKSEQWKLIHNMDWNEATKNLTNDERTRLAKKTAQVANALMLGSLSGNRKSGGRA